MLQLFISDKHQQALLEFVAIEFINWYCILSRSPHFGRLWKAAVKTTKHHFYGAVGSKVLGYKERTLLCHIAAVLNSWPSVSLPEDPADLDALKPAHFITEDPSAIFIESDVIDESRI